MDGQHRALPDQGDTGKTVPVTQEQQRSWWQRRPVLVLVIGAAVTAFGLVWWLLPPVLYAGAGEDAENVRVKAITDTRTALLVGLVGLGALGTFWLNSRVYRITARTFEVTERGHLTDRYTKAIEQLGSATLNVRLGGIYALEQIATDSRRTRDQATGWAPTWSTEPCGEAPTCPWTRSSTVAATDKSTFSGRLV